MYVGMPKQILQMVMNERKNKWKLKADSQRLSMMFICETGFPSSPRSKIRRILYGTTKFRCGMVYLI